MEEVRHCAIGTVQGGEFVAAVRCLPIALGAGYQDGCAWFVPQPVDVRSATAVAASACRRARGSASTSAHHSSPAYSNG